MGSGTLRFALLPDEGGHYFLVQHIGLAKTMDFVMRKKIVSASRRKSWVWCTRWLVRRT
ncbi:MAG: hypothetical protein CM1200mP4_2950 [Rhodospirillaceae bacterium]|nr:MAG: hypothetical protein CM1200mP4_2950 [Rhodospirillaceae bacterium]